VTDKEDIRARFFSRFGDRLKTARDCDIPNADRLILLTACLDALAMHWMSTCAEPEKTSRAGRMRRFLLRHGQHDAWSRVSAPLLRDRVVSAEAKADIEQRFPFLRYKPRQYNEVATWKDDPTFDDIQATNLVKPKPLVGCSYPGIVYKELRCGWLHESRGESDAVETPARDDFAGGEPSYSCDFSSARLSLVVPVSFLVQTLERALKSFEQEASERDIVPYIERAHIGEL